MNFHDRDGSMYDLLVSCSLVPIRMLRVNKVGRRVPEFEVAQKVKYGLCRDDYVDARELTTLWRHDGTVLSSLRSLSISGLLLTTIPSDARKNDKSCKILFPIRRSSGRSILRVSAVFPTQSCFVCHSHASTELNHPLLILSHFPLKLVPLSVSSHSFMTTGMIALALVAHVSSRT